MMFIFQPLIDHRLREMLNHANQLWFPLPVASAVTPMQMISTAPPVFVTLWEASFAAGGTGEGTQSTAGKAEEDFIIRHYACPCRDREDRSWHIAVRERGKSDRNTLKNPLISELREGCSLIVHRSKG
jgi:hypothetical protein